MKNRGVYFVANDRIIELVIAFLNSFRKHNPNTPLCLIPFRSDIRKLEELKDVYNFTIYNDSVFLEQCDNISLLFHEQTTGHYRKLACWHGPFDQFIYIDVDMVVLKDLDFAFDLLDEFDFLTSCSNIKHAEQWVWKPSIYETGTLSNEQISYAANTGFVVSQKGFIPSETLMSRAHDAQKLSEHMELYCKEQPFLNYLIVTSGRRYSSLWNLLDSELFPQNYIEYWAGNGRKKLQSGIQTLHNGKLHEIFLIHWAGVWQLNKMEISLFKILNLFRIRRKIWAVSIFMPLRRIWKSYRYIKV